MTFDRFTELCFGDVACAPRPERPIGRMQHAVFLAFGSQVSDLAQTAETESLLGRWQDRAADGGIVFG